MTDRERRVRALHELPQALEPSRDLWPQIEAQLRAGTPVRPARTAERYAAPAWRWAAVAALVLLAAALGLRWLPGRLTPQQPVGGAGALAQVNAGARDVTPVSAAEDAAAHEALLLSLNERLRSLPPSTQQQVRADLQLIERSMQDIQSALGRDPGSALLHEMLRETEQDEQHLAATVRDAGVWTEEAMADRGGSDHEQVLCNHFADGGDTRGRRRERRRSLGGAAGCR